KTSGGRSDRAMREGTNMGIMTTLKKPTAEREGALGGLPTVQTVLDLGTMLRDRHPHRRELKHLPSLVVARGHLLQRDPTVPAPLDGVEVDMVWLSHGLQRVALVAGLRTALSAAALAQIVRAGLLPSGAGRWLAAVAAVFPQVVLKGFNPCLEVEDEGRQLPHQGPYGFFAPQVGGMDNFWGRYASWCYAVYCAWFLAVLHQGMMNFLVCLSSNGKRTASPRISSLPGRKRPAPTSEADRALRQPTPQRS